MKILVTKFRNIGDVLLTGPLVSTLKHHWPDARIAVLVKSGTEAVMTGHPHVDEVLVYPPRLSDESRIAYLRRELAWLRILRSRRFDLAINTTEGDRGAILGWLSRAPRRIGLAKAHGDKRWRRWLYTEVMTELPPPRHTVIRNLDLARFQTMLGYRHVHLTFEERDLHSVRRRLRALGWREEIPLVQVHPTSRWFFKCWNDADTARVIDHLQQVSAVQVVVTAGPEPRERERIERILAQCRSRPLDLGGQLTLKETAALAGLCRMFFGVDTAPMHMAAALGVPVVALFGPSGAFDWGPWPNGWEGEATPYPARGGLQQCGPHAVIQKDWACVPCGRDGCDGSKRSACLEQTRAEDVIPVIERTLAVTSAPGAVDAAP